jgi:CspA family cold shock protein
MRQKGTVKWFNPQKGYGFITSDDGRDLFVHSTFLGFEVKTLEENERVSFEIKQMKHGLAATKVFRENAE